MFCRVTLDHSRGHCVGMLLVGISLLAYAALKVHVAALLHDVRRLVRRCMEIWRAAKNDCFPHCVGRGAD